MARCKVCRAEYTKSRPLQSCCSVTCAIEHAKTKREAKDRKDTRTALSKLKTRSEWMKEAQKAVNAWVRMRDKLAGYPCICCGKPLDWNTPNKVDAGHYRSTGSAPHMRLMPFGNINAQLVFCNRWRGGRALEQAPNIAARWGQDALGAIDSDQTSRKYSVDDLQEIAQGFRQWAREMQKEKPA